MEPNYCQSCGMPLVNETDPGTNQDGNKKHENGESYTKEEALAGMQYYFPHA